MVFLALTLNLSNKKGNNFQVPAMNKKAKIYAYVSTTSMCGITSVIVQVAHVNTKFWHHFIPLTAFLVV